MQKADKQIVCRNLGRCLRFASVFIFTSNVNRKRKVCERSLYACDILVTKPYTMHTSTLDRRMRLMLPVITEQTLYDDNQTHCFHTNIN